jgi:hypothetical protein
MRVTRIIIQAAAVAVIILSIGVVLPASGSAAISAGVASPEALGLKAIEPAANKDAVLSYSTAKERLDPDAVQYFVNTFHVTKEVASERLTIQTMVPNLATQLSEALGDDFGALRFDNDDGQFVIDARPSGVSEAEHLMSSVGLAGHYSIVTVPWNTYELANLRSGLENELKPASVGIAGDHITVETHEAPTSADQETVARSRQAFAKSEGISNAPTVEVKQQPSGKVAFTHGSVSCGKYGIGDSTGGFCNTLVAGDRWYTSAGECTMAWWVSIKEREPKEFPSILTAGHCIAGVGTVKPTDTCEPEETSCQQFGLTLTYYQGEGRGDAGLIDYYSGLYGSPTFPLATDYWNWWDGEPSPLEYYITGEPWAGLTVCLQGYRTGSSCGEVVKSGLTENPGNGIEDSNMTEVKLNSGKVCEGDSGGPWDRAEKDTAVGIQSLAVLNEEHDECGTIAYITPVYEPINDFGLIMWGGSGWHEPW